MKTLYTIGVHFYGFLIRIASIFNPKAKEWIRGRKNQWEQFPDTKNKEVIWFHCASLGEFDQGLPVMNLIKDKNPDTFLLVTFFSPSGYHHFHKRKNEIDYACYLPLDTPKNAQRFIAHFQPKIGIFVKYEFWSHFIFSLKKSHAKIYSISTILRPDHRFFKWYGGFFRKTLRQFDFFFVQNQETAKLLESIGISECEITGDNRFDRVIENKDSLQVDQRILSFVGASTSVFIAGSTWEVDEKIILPFTNSTTFEKTIIAPHTIDEKHIQSIQQQLTIPAIRYSKLDNLSNENVLILDTIGQLASAYSVGQLAYVGGGFTGNLHNILEPAVFGLPVLFGPKHLRFPEANAFINEGFGMEVTSLESLQQAVSKCEENYGSLHEKAILFVSKNAGASKKIVSHIDVR